MCLLHLQPPKTLYPWQGTRNATRFGWACPQNGDLIYVERDMQDEDCLYLNVYAPYDVRITKYF